MLDRLFSRVGRFLFRVALIAIVILAWLWFKLYEMEQRRKYEADCFEAIKKNRSYWHKPSNNNS